MSEGSAGRTRRAFLESTVLLAGAIPAGLAIPSYAQPNAACPKSAKPVSKYRSLNSSEAAFTETMVNVLCPADHLTPSGVDCGLTSFIDRQLAGDFGREERRLGRKRFNQEQFFKTGITAANAICVERFGGRFEQLSAPAALGCFRDMACGRLAHPSFPLDSWIGEFVEPLLIQASFAGLTYEWHGNKVFWKLFGHTGA